MTPGTIQRWPPARGWKRLTASVAGRRVDDARAAAAQESGPNPITGSAIRRPVTPADSGGQIFYEEILGGGDGWFFWMPGIAVNQRGDLMIVYQRSHASMSVGVGFIGREAGSGFEAGKLVNGRCGLDNFDGSRNRTGDYVGVQTDPAGSLDFWIAGEYSGQVGRFGCNWRTRIARIVF